MGTTKRFAISEAMRARLAACAHAIWCEHMQAEGWRAGALFDADARVHDWLAPFESLAASDRDLIVSWICQEDLPQQLVKIVTSASLWDELTLRDFTEGTAVRLRDTGNHADEAAAPQGRVTGWEIGSPGTERVNSVRVLWDDGEQGEYGPDELELIQPEQG